RSYRACRLQMSCRLCTGRTRWERNWSIASTSLALPSLSVERRTPRNFAFATKLSRGYEGRGSGSLSIDAVFGKIGVQPFGNAHKSWVDRLPTDESGAPEGAGRSSVGSRS